MKRKFDLLKSVEKKGNHCEDYYVIDEIIIEQGKHADVNLRRVEKAVEKIIKSCTRLIKREHAAFNFHLSEKFEDEGTIRDTDLYFYGMIVNRRIVIGTHTREEIISLIDNRIRETYNIPESYYCLEEYFLEQDEEQDDLWYKYEVYDTAIEEFKKEEKGNLLSKLIDYLDDLRNFI